MLKFYEFSVLAQLLAFVCFSQIPPQETWNSDYIGFSMTFEPQGEPDHAFPIKIPNSQLNTYKAGGLLKYKHYKVSVRAYNLNGKGASNDSAVAWAWTQEDGKRNPYA